MHDEKRTATDALTARVVAVQVRENRAGRRKQQAIARKQRHLFNRYKAHMASKGYDATFDDFIKDMP